MVAIVLAVALVATGAVAAVQTVRVQQALADQQELEEKLAVARDRLDAGAAGSDGATDDDGSGTGEGGALDDLLGDGALGGLLDGLLDDDGALGDAAALAACATDPSLGRLDVDDTDGAAQYDDIEQAVEDIRDLAFTDEVDPSYLTPDEITDRITETITEEYAEEEADVDRRVLAALGAIDPGLDLRQTQIDLLGEQVAGFYDSDTGEMVVGTGAPDAPLGPTDQVTLAHELIHALTDQALGLPEILDDESADGDAALAALAVVEGDATLSMQRFAGAALDMGEQLALATDPRALGAQAQLAEFPYVLQRQLSFPYEAGLRYACALHRSGGWDAVDAAYADLPTSTAEILFPGRTAAPPSAPEPPASPGGAWQEARTDTLGAAELKWLFEAPGDDEAAALSEPLERVARWAGGALRLWTDGDDSALGVVLRQRADDGPSLCESVTAWYDAAFADDEQVATADGEAFAARGGYQSAVITCTGDEIRLGAAPTLETAREIVG